VGVLVPPAVGIFMLVLPNVRAPGILIQFEFCWAQAARLSPERLGLETSFLIPIFHSQTLRWSLQ
jgi:hypothetical protein